VNSTNLEYRCRSRSRHGSGELSRSGLASSTLPSLSPDEPSYSANSKQQHWDRADTVHAQFPEISEGILLRVLRVVVNDYSLADFEFLFLGAFPTIEGLFVHGEGVPVTIMVRWLMCCDDSLRCLLSRCDFSVNFPLVDKKNRSECPRKDNEEIPPRWIRSPVCCSLF
jgi:hypothetical protein